MLVRYQREIVLLALMLKGAQTLACGCIVTTYALCRESKDSGPVFLCSELVSSVVSFTLSLTLCLITLKRCPLRDQDSSNSVFPVLSRVCSVSIFWNTEVSVCSGYFALISGIWITSYAVFILCFPMKNAIFELNDSWIIDPEQHWRRHVLWI